MTILFLFLLVLSVCKSETIDGPIVQTPLGKIKGFRQTSFGGKTFSSFEGIRYAKPPIGARRFEEPEPIGPWNGTWDARYPSICSQAILTPYKEATPSEDCLHVNIYVPLEQPSAAANLDVIVHIHGGAYMFGHGNYYCRPTYIMDHDVIFITFNYRLGVFGFLSTEDDVVSGNMGLKDQVLLLKWIQSNIKSFGGNPNSVTLSGMSAGSASTHLHYFSGMSRGLFHRGLAQSGLGVNLWSLKANPLENAQKLAKAVECPSSPNKLLIECLKQKPEKQILETMHLFYVYSILPLPFLPVVEKGPKPFLKDSPYNLLLKKEVLDVPLIASNVKHEGTFPAQLFLADLENINKNWAKLAPFLLEFNPNWQNVSQKIKDHYFGQGQDINQKNYLKLVEIFSDRYFFVDGEDALLRQAAANKSSIYYLRFSYPGDFNEQKIVGHGADAKYFFGQVLENPRALTANELKMKDVMVEMLVSYAKTGVPALPGVNWQPTKDDQLSYADVAGFESKDIEIIQTANFPAKEFWKSLGL